MTFNVICEYDIGQTALTFETELLAEEWIDKVEASGILDELDTTTDELKDDGLLYLEEVSLVKNSKRFVFLIKSDDVDLGEVIPAFSSIDRAKDWVEKCVWFEDHQDCKCFEDLQDVGLVTVTKTELI